MSNDSSISRTFVAQKNERIVEISILNKYDIVWLYLYFRPVKMKTEIVFIIFRKTTWHRLTFERASPCGTLDLDREDKETGKFLFFNKVVRICPCRRRHGLFVLFTHIFVISRQTAANGDCRLFSNWSSFLFSFTIYIASVRLRETERNSLPVNSYIMNMYVELSWLV